MPDSSVCFIDSFFSVRFISNALNFGPLDLRPLASNIAGSVVVANTGNRRFWGWPHLICFVPYSVVIISAAESLLDTLVTVYKPIILSDYFEYKILNFVSIVCSEEKIVEILKTKNLRKVPLMKAFVDTVRDSIVSFLPAEEFIRDIVLLCEILADFFLTAKGPGSHRLGSGGEA